MIPWQLKSTFITNKHPMARSSSSGFYSATKTTTPKKDVLHFLYAETFVALQRKMKFSESADEADWRRWRKGQADCAGAGAAIFGEAFDSRRGSCAKGPERDRRLAQPPLQRQRARDSITGVWPSICVHLFHLRIVRRILVGLRRSFALKGSHLAEENVLPARDDDFPSIWK
jgi:hypothetical protein